MTYEFANPYPGLRLEVLQTNSVTNFVMVAIVKDSSTVIKGHMILSF